MYAIRSYYAVQCTVGPGLEGAQRYQFLLLLRFTLINLIGLGLLALAQVHGWITLTLEADRTHLVVVIFLVFLAGLGNCAYRIVQTIV